MENGKYGRGELIEVALKIVHLKKIGNKFAFHYLAPWIDKLSIEEQKVIRFKMNEDEEINKIEYPHSLSRRAIQEKLGLDEEIFLCVFGNTSGKDNQHKYFFVLNKHLLQEDVRLKTVNNEDEFNKILEHLVEKGLLFHTWICKWWNGTRIGPSGDDAYFFITKEKSNEDVSRSHSCTADEGSRATI